MTPFQIYILIQNIHFKSISIAATPLRKQSSENFDTDSVSGVKSWHCIISKSLVLVLVSHFGPLFGKTHFTKSAQFCVFNTCASILQQPRSSRRKSHCISWKHRNSRKNNTKQKIERKPKGKRKGKKNKAWFFENWMFCRNQNFD